MKTSVNAILIALLLCLSTIPMTVSAQGDSIQNEVAYGIEYDWSNLDEDIDSLTGINLNEILSRTMLAATDAGLTLTVAQLSTGSSNIYVESAEDRTATTIEIGGESHSVWTRATDVTIRHAVLFDSALVTEWIDSSGADPTGFDGYLSVDSENAVAVDVNMVEYFDDDYNLYGIDMDFSLASEVSVEYQMDAGLEGAGEEFDFALTFGTGFDLNVPEASAEWRLDEKTPIFPTLSTYEDVEVECADDPALTTSGSEALLKMACGTMDGDYSVSTGFTFDLSDIPTENFGMDAGLLDISISDEISSSGTYEMDMEDFLNDGDGDHHETEEDEGHHHHGDGDYHHDHVDGSDGHTHDDADRHHDHDDDDSDDDDGETDGYGGDPHASIIIAEGGSPVDVVSCECGTANPIMFLMLAAMLTNIGEAFAEDAAEELGDTFEDEFSEAIEEFGEALGGGDEEDDDEDDDYSEWFTCANGMDIDEWRQDDSNNDCGDWSDETAYDTFYPCDDIETSMEGVQLYEVNNGIDDCSDLSDENVLWLQHVGLDIQTKYQCADGSRDVSEWSLGNGWEECDDGSDEWPLAEETLTSTETMNVGSNGYADRDPDDTGTDAYCYIAGMTVTDPDTGDAIFDGNLLMSAGYVTGHAGEEIGPYDGTREFSSSGHISQYTLPAGLTGCDELTQAQVDSMDEFSPEYVGSSNVVTHDGSLKRMMNGAHMHVDDGNEFEFNTYYNGVHMDDEDYTLQVVILSDDDEVIATESMDVESDDWDTSGQIEVDDLEPGDYCVEFHLVDSSGSAVDTYDSDDSDDLCMTVEEVPEWLMELGAIVEAFGESDFEETLEDFGSNLEDRLGGITEDIAYQNAMFHMWWSPTHHTVVGTSLVVQDNMETWYTLVGPEISEVYSDDVSVDTGAAPATIGLNYLIGDAASSAAVGMADAQSVEDIADTAAHAADMGEFAQVLEDAGVDPASIGIDPVDETPAEPETAEEMIDEGIFGLPSVSGLATIAILALAGIVVAQRNRDEE